MPLDGNKYLTWSRSVIITLKAKDKLSFINGKCKILEDDPTKHGKWQSVDNMVTFWILKSISKELVDAFLYANSIKKLWKELK